jgi:hypothetical protein
MLVLVHTLGFVATLIVAVVLFKVVQRATSRQRRIIAQIVAMMLGSVIAAAGAAVAITLVVESIRSKSAPVRAVPEVPVEPEVSAEPEAAPAPLPSRPAPPRKHSQVIQQAPPINVEKPKERKPTTTLGHHEYEVQAP